LCLILQDLCAAVCTASLCAAAGHMKLRRPPVGSSTVCVLTAARPVTTPAITVGSRSDQTDDKQLPFSSCSHFSFALRLDTERSYCWHNVWGHCYVTMLGLKVKMCDNLNLSAFSASPSLRLYICVYACLFTHTHTHTHTHTVSQYIV